MTTPNNPQAVDPNSPLGQGIPTQTPDSVAAVPNAVTPNPNPSAPNAPVAPTVTPNPTPNQPNQPNQSTTAPNAAPTPHEALYSKFLKMLNPPTRFVDENGVQQSQPQTGKNIGNNVLAAVLAGMMSPTKYREGAYGPVVDSSGTAAGAFAAGQKQKQDQNDAAQKLSVDQQTRKLATAKNNVDMMHLWAATSHELGQDAQEQADNFAPTLKIAQDHDQNLQAGDKKAVLAGGMTMAEALKHPEFKDALTKHSIIPDGVIQVDDGQGHLVPTQTFSIIDPNVQVSMDKDSVDILSQINSQWRTAFEKSGGSLKMRLGQIQAVTNQVNSVRYAERLFNDAAQSDDAAVKSLGLKGDINGEIMSAVRNGTPGAAQALKSLSVMENAKAAGGSTLDALDRLVNDPDARAGSGYILNALGTTSDKVSKFVREARLEQERQNALAKEGGMGDKAPAAPEQIKGLVDAIKTNPDLTDSDRKLLMTDVPAANKDGVINMTQGQVKALVTRTDIAVTASKSNAEKSALANGDPATVQKMASDIIEGDVGATAKLSSMRGNARQNTINGIHDEAVRRGLDPTQFSPSAMDAKDEMWKDFHENKGTGLNRTAFDTFLGHANDALDASDVWKRSNSPLLNKSMNWLAKNVSDDPTYTKFAAALEPVRTEFMSFLKNNRAEHSADIDTMQSVLNDKQTPAQIEASLQQLAKSADIRLAAIGAQYLSTMGTTYPNLVSDKGKAALQRFGIKAESPALSQNLPRGWVNGQAQKLTNPNIAKQFVLAAGGNNAKAAEIAKQNGWSF